MNWRPPRPAQFILPPSSFILGIRLAHPLRGPYIDPFVQQGNITMSTKILVADKLAEEGLEYLKQEGAAFDVKAGISDDELAAIIGNYDAMIVRSAPKKAAISKAL